MPERESPNLARRRRLAAELRRLREHAGLTGDEVANRLGWPTSSKLSRIELGRTGLKQDDLVSLLDLYGVTAERRTELTALAEESRKAGPIEARTRRLLGSQVAIQQDEQDAESIWIWEPQIFPGLFQTETYTRSIVEASAKMFRDPPGEAERRIETRRLRQSILARDPPLGLVAVIDESVLRRLIGNARVMHDQLMHAAAISELPNVMIRVLPLAGDHLVVTGSFNYIQYRQIHDVPLSDVVASENLTGMDYVESDDGTHKYYLAFQSLLNISLDAEQSRALVRQLATEVWT